MEVKKENTELTWSGDTMTEEAVRVVDWALLSPSVEDLLGVDADDTPSGSAT